VLGSPSWIGAAIALHLRIYSLNDLEDEPGLRYRKNIAIEELSLSAASRIMKLLPERGMLQERR
jgi:hypothetical protein